MNGEDIDRDDIASRRLACEDYVRRRKRPRRFCTAKTLYSEYCYREDFYREDCYREDFYREDFYREDFYRKDFYREDLS